MSIFQIDRRSIANFDWFYLAVAVILAVVGVFNIASAAAGTTLWRTQAYWLVLSLAAAVVVLLIDYKRYEKMAPMIYLLTLALLIGVHFFGKRISGSRSWYDFGMAHLQPSELMKIALIMMFAHVYHRDTQSRLWGIREIVWPALLAAVPVLSIALEPDMGTALTVMLLFGSMMVFAGVKRKYLITAAAIAALVLVSYPVWNMALKEHQRQRIETFLHPEKDLLGAGYNVLQAKIAVGSGGMAGKGYMKGSMHMLRFLPEQHTDFAFGVWAEEWGFLWVAVVLALYGALIYRGLAIAGEAKDKYGVMLAIGCTVLLFWHIFINISMVVGLFPVIGVPLPFMSYGGSNLLTFMIAVALVINVRMRKYFL